MQKFIEYLQGKKTYLLAVCIAGYSVSIAFDWIITTADQNIAVYGLLAALFGIAAKAGSTRELKGRRIT